MSFRGWKQFASFYFFAAVALCLGLAASTGGEFSKRYIFLLIVSGLLTWSIVEYVLHRFVFHFGSRSELGRKFIYAAHQFHHENPKSTDHLFTSLRMSVPIAAVYWLVAWLAIGSWRATSFLSIGLFAGYFCYEWLHYQAHHGAYRLRLFRYLRKYHMMHHHLTPDLRFGVTSPVLDLAFGTFRSVGRNRPRAQVRGNRVVQ